MLTMDPRPRSRMRLAISRETTKLPTTLTSRIGENHRHSVSSAELVARDAGGVDEAGDRAELGLAALDRLHDRRLVRDVELLEADALARWL